MLSLDRNPLVYREFRRIFRPTKFWGTIIVFSVILLLGFSYFYLTLHSRYERMSAADWTALWRFFGYFILMVQMFVAYYATMAFSLDSIVEEKQQNAYEFFVTLPIAPADKMLGLFVGKAMMPAVITIFLLPFSIASNLAGGMEAGTLIWIYVLMFAAATAAGLFGVALSPSLGERKTGWLLSFLLLLFTSWCTVAVLESDSPFVPMMAISPYSFLTAATSDHWAYASRDYHFFSMTVPWQVCPLALFIYVALFSFWAGTRRFSKMSPQPMRREAIIGAFIIFNLLVVGFMADILYETTAVKLLGADPDIAETTSFFSGGSLSRGDYACAEAIGSFSFVSFLLILSWSLASTPNYQKLMQWAEKKSPWPVRIFTESFTDLRSPAIVPVVLLWATAIGTMILINMYFWDATLSNARIILVGALTLLYLLIYQAAFLLANLVARRNGLMLGLLFMLVIIAVPGIFSSIPGMANLIYATPAGLMVNMSHNILLGNWHDASGHVFRILGTAAAELAIMYLICTLAFRAMLRISPLRKQTTAAA